MKNQLKKYDENKVDIFISYVNQLKTELKDGKPKNAWAKGLSDQVYIDAFKKEYETGLFIDGDTVTLNFLGKLVITHDYHAYMNKVLLSYPDATFDFGIVYEKDKFSSRKESGKVVYSHIIDNPFALKRVIVGAYGVIKCSKGEFIETIDTDVIEQMKKTSRMAFIWNAWLDRMVLKSIVKRICNVHFKDITKGIEMIDNETNDPERVLMPQSLIDTVDECDNNEQLEKIYHANIENLKGDEKTSFIKAVKIQKEIIKEGLAA